MKSTWEEAVGTLKMQQTDKKISVNKDAFLWNVLYTERMFNAETKKESAEGYACISVSLRNKTHILIYFSLTNKCTFY